ncbi:unnamed protein product [Rhodiola kirilowii]
MELYYSNSYYLYLALSTALFLIILTKLVKRFNLSKLNLPPGPPGWPLLGNLHLVKPPLHRNLHAISLKYGPVFSLRLGYRLAVIVSSPAAVEECFTKNDVIFANRPPLRASRRISYDFKSMGQSPYGEHWRNLRKLGNVDIFSNARLNTFLNLRREEVRLLLRKLYNCCPTPQEFGTIELRSRLSDLTLNNIMRMVAGEKYNETAARKLQAIAKEILEFGGMSDPGDFVKILGWLDFYGVEKRAIQIVETMDGFLQGLIDEHRTDQNGKSEVENTMINHLLSLQKSQPEYYTDQTIRMLIMDMIIAGTETTVVSIEWAMSLLLNHPDKLEKARAELSAATGDDDVLIDEHHIPHLPYLQAIISETFRLYPPGPLLLPHYSSGGDCTVGGYTIPNGTMLFVNAWAIQRDPTVWENPSEFWPERFEKREVGESYRLMPFGVGRRACPGAGLANRLLACSLGALIQCFEWKRVGEELVDMAEADGLTMPRAEPLVAMCKPLNLNVLHKVMAELDA